VPSEKQVEVATAEPTATEAKTEPATETKTEPTGDTPSTEPTGTAPTGTEPNFGPNTEPRAEPTTEPSAEPAAAAAATDTTVAADNSADATAFDEETPEQASGPSDLVSAYTSSVLIQATCAFTSDVLLDYEHLTSGTNYCV
jgi:hypothetical protein